jgi:hypothetical protein
MIKRRFIYNELKPPFQCLRVECEHLDYKTGKCGFNRFTVEVNTIKNNIIIDKKEFGKFNKIQECDKFIDYLNLIPIMYQKIA